MVTFYIPNSEKPLPTTIDSNAVYTSDVSDDSTDINAIYCFTGHEITSGENKYFVGYGYGYNYICVPISNYVEKIVDVKSSFTYYLNTGSNNGAIIMLADQISIDGELYKVYRSNAPQTVVTTLEYSITIKEV